MDWHVFSECAGEKLTREYRVDSPGGATNSSTASRRQFSTSCSTLSNITVSPSLNCLREVGVEPAATVTWYPQQSLAGSSNAEKCHFLARMVHT